MADRSPPALFRESLSHFLVALNKYREAHALAYGSRLSDDYVLGKEWARIAKGMLGLLNGELGGLDGATLDRAIRDITEAAGFDRDLALTQTNVT